MANTKKRKKKVGSKGDTAIDAPQKAMRSNGADRLPGQRLTEMVPVRFEPGMLEEVRRRAAGDDRSVSAWIRRAVDKELRSDV